MMRHYGGYRLGCASGSWSDLLRVTGRNHLWSASLGNFSNFMWFSIVCCYSFCHMICSADAEDHIDYIVFFNGNHLVSPFVHFSLFAIECIHHGVCHGG
jgi:hypothetical protein